MLHLDARVHLDEIELPGVVKQELDGPGAHVVDRLGRPHRSLAHPRAQLGRERRRRGLLDQLLMPALDGAVPLAEMHHPSAGVAEDLELDVARPFNAALQIDAAVAERRLGLGARRGEVPQKGAFVPGDSHPLPSAACAGLDHDRIPDLPGHLQRLAFVGHRSFRTGNDRDAGGAHRLAGDGLVPHGANLVRRGPHEHQIGAVADLRELRVLGQEAVSRVHRLRTGDLGGGNDPSRLQVRLSGAGRPDADGFVGEADMQRLPVRLRIDGDRRNVELAARPHDAQRDFSPVRDQQLAEHPAAPRVRLVRRGREAVRSRPAPRCRRRSPRCAPTPRTRARS